ATAIDSVKQTMSHFEMTIFKDLNEALTKRLREKLEFVDEGKRLLRQLDDKVKLTVDGGLKKNLVRGAAETDDWVGLQIKEWVDLSNVRRRLQSSFSSAGDGGVIRWRGPVDDVLSARTQQFVEGSPRVGVIAVDSFGTTSFRSIGFDMSS